MEMLSHSISRDRGEVERAPEIDHFGDVNQMAPDGARHSKEAQVERYLTARRRPTFAHASSSCSP